MQILQIFYKNLQIFWGEHKNPYWLDNTPRKLGVT